MHTNAKSHKHQININLTLMTMIYLKSIQIIFSHRRNVTHDIANDIDTFKLLLHKYY